MELVYIGRGEGDKSFKIGRSNSTSESRLLQQKTSSPTFQHHVRLETGRGKDLESMLHQFFSSRRVRGSREWFALTPSDLDTAKHLAEVYERELFALRDEVEHLGQSRSCGTCHPARTDDVEEYHRLAVIRERRARLDQEEQLIVARLKCRIGVHDGIEGLFTWKSQQQLRFNSQSFRQEHGLLYEKFRLPTTLRYFRVL